MRLRAGLGVCLALTASIASAATPSPTPAPVRELRVGVFEAPPFAMKAGNGDWRGLTVDLWKELAGALGLRYRFDEGSEDAILEGIAHGRLDLAAGPFAATMERQQTLDFSFTYLTTGQAVAVRHRGRMDRLLTLLHALAVSPAVHIIAAIIVLSLLFGTAVWLSERRRNPQFPARPTPGIGSGFWWAGVTTSGVGYGDKVPVTLRGRVLAMIWMLISLVLYVALTAGLTASLAVAEFEARGPATLRYSKVGALDGSAAADFLRKNQIRRSVYPTFARALDALARGEVDAVMGGEAILRYYAERDARAGIEVLPGILMSERLAFPLPDGSALRDPLNRELRRALAGPRWKDVQDRYLGASGADTAP